MLQQKLSGWPHCRIMGLRRPPLSPLGVEHFDEQVVAGHVAVQVFVVQVFFGLQADGSDLWQPEEQLAELVRLLRVVAHDVVQQRRVDLLLDTLDEVEVLQVLHICAEEARERLDELAFQQSPRGGSMATDKDNRVLK